MRNSPLWRPQPSGNFDDSAQIEERGGISTLAMVGLGLTIAAGVGAIGAFALLGAEAEMPATVATAAIQAQSSKLQPAVSSLPGVVLQDPLPSATGTFSAQPAPTAARQGDDQGIIEVAIAETEFDVARLEVMTGMIEPDVAAPSVSPDERGSTAAIDASGLRPGNADADFAPPAGDDTETASIEPAEIIPPQAAAEDRPKPVVAALPPMRAAKVNDYVNLRTGPADEARVIMVVPAGAAVQAQSNCGWCVVTYKGQRGYIYKSFLQVGAGPSAVSSKSAPGLF